MIEQRTAAETAPEEERYFITWDTTPEEADKIAAGDRDAMNAFYFRNLPHLRSVARAYARRRNLEIGRNVYEVDELLAQLWVDLPALNWRNSSALTYSIKYVSFAWAPYGGYTQRKESGLFYGHMPHNHKGLIDGVSGSLDGLINLQSGENDSLRLLDTIAEDETPETLLESKIRRNIDPEELAAAFADILGKRELIYFAQYLDGVMPSMIAHDMGICYTGVTSYKNEVHRKLVLNYEKVLERLERLGVSVPFYCKRRPEDYDAMLEALEKKRARDRVKDENRKRRRFTSEEERRAALAECKARWNLKRKEKTAAARAAKAAAEGARA